MQTLVWVIAFAAAFLVGWLFVRNRQKRSRPEK